MSCNSHITSSTHSGNGSFRQNSMHEKLHYSSSGEEKIKFAGDESKDRLYEPKKNKKMMRVLTVIIYVFSVSLAAIMLSLYYVFFWNPKGPQYAPKGAEASANGGNISNLKCADEPEGFITTDSRPGTGSAASTPSQFPSDLLYDEGADKMAAAGDNEANLGASTGPADFIDVNNDTSFPQAKSQFWAKLLEASGARVKFDSVKR